MLRRERSESKCTRARGRSVGSGSPGRIGLFGAMGVAIVAVLLIALTQSLTQAQLVLPALPGSPSEFGFTLYVDAQLGFELALAPGWKEVADTSPSTANLRRFARPFSSTQSSESSAQSPAGPPTPPAGERIGPNDLWLQVLRLPGQTQGEVSAARLQEIREWLSGQYGEWRWLQPLGPPQSQTTRPWLATGAGTGTDAWRQTVQVQLWVAAGPTPDGPFYLLVAGGVQPAFQNERASVERMVASFRPTNPRTEAAAPGLQPFSWTEQGISLPQPAGWRVETQLLGSERILKLISSDGQAIVRLHVLPLPLTDPSPQAEENLIAQLGVAYLTQLAKASAGSGAMATPGAATPSGSPAASRSPYPPAEPSSTPSRSTPSAVAPHPTDPSTAGSPALPGFRVEVSGVSKQTPGQFEGLYTYRDHQAGPAAGWVVMRWVSAGYLVVLDAQAVADVFPLLYPTFRAMWDSLSIMPPSPSPSPSPAPSPSPSPPPPGQPSSPSSD